MTLHLRPVPRKYDFALEQVRKELIEDLKREKMRKQAANDDIPREQPWWAK